MGVVTVVVCDVCHASDGVRTFEIKPPDERRFSVDLCPAHAAPLLELRAKATSTTRGAPKPRTPSKRPGSPRRRTKLGVALDLPALQRACTAAGKTLADVAGGEKTAQEWLADIKRPGIDRLREVARALSVPAGRLALGGEVVEHAPLDRRLIDFMQDFFGYCDGAGDPDTDLADDLGIDRVHLQEIRHWRADPTSLLGGRIVTRLALPIEGQIPETAVEHVHVGRDVELDPAVLTVGLAKSFRTGPGSDETPPGLTRLARGIDIDAQTLRAIVDGNSVHVDESIAHRITAYLYDCGDVEELIRDRQPVGAGDAPGVA